MNIDEVKRSAFAMPLTSLGLPPGPDRFVNPEFRIVAYRTDPDALRAVVPEPLQFDDAVVKYELIRMPDSTGFGDYTESEQVMPVRFATGPRLRPPPTRLVHAVRRAPQQARRAR